VIHFLPPHFPFIRKPVTKGGVGPDLPGRSDSAWNMAEKGDIDHDTVEEAYRDNMRYVEKFVAELAENLDGKTVLRSDHGNLVGEAGVYGHPTERMEKPLKKVPYKQVS
jgi:hypothetical protein